MIKKIVIFTCVLICLMVSGCQKKEDTVNIPELIDPPQSVSDTAVVKRGEICNIKLYDAQVIPYTKEIGFKTEGVIDNVNVKIGDVVKEGDVLATLTGASDNSGYTSVTDQIDNLKKTYAEDNLLAEYDIKIMKAEKEQMLLKLNSAHKKEKSDIKKNIQVKKANIKVAEQEYVDNKELQKLELIELKRKLKQMESDKKNFYMYAPMDGVIATVAKNAGDQIGEDEFVMALVDNEDMQIKSEYISSKLLKNSDYFVKYNGNEYKVEKTGYEVVDQPDTDDDQNVNSSGAFSYFDVVDNIVEFDVGSYLNLYIKSGYNQNALLIPSNALYKESSEKYVYKQVGETKVKTEVTVGTITDTVVQITDGLQEGDIVYVQK